MLPVEISSDVGAQDELSRFQVRHVWNLSSSDAPSAPISPSPRKLPAPIPNSRLQILPWNPPPYLRNSMRRAKSKKSNRKRVAVTVLNARSEESPYDVLGVPPSATPDQIKRAYRKLALKYHPDVNKEENAQGKFMRIKHAYNTLVNSKSKRNYNYRSRSSSYSGSSSSGQDEEEFYGFEDFFRDLQKEFQNWEADTSSQGKPKSLWEELADIGEEFVEFLENELNITNSGDESVEGDSDRKSDDVKTESTAESRIEEHIDEVEAALAKLKKELGLQ
ncbi:hypothetical protein ACLOJK_030045 [Asimina triloba]